MSKFIGVLAAGLAASSLAACAMGGSSPKPDVAVNQLGTSPSGIQQLEEQRCGSVEQQGLVGKAVSTIPANVAARASVVASNAIPSDSNPARLRIIFDPSNNMVTQVRCG